MSTLAAALIGAVVAWAATVAATPVAIRAAWRLDFLDRPRQYRKHARPTPFLGGTAVLAGVLVAALVIGAFGRYYVILTLALVMWAIGTTDDRFAVPPHWRLLAEAVAAGVMHFDGLGWHLAGVPGAVSLLLTVFWTIALINAFNLMDNQDGACGTVGAVSAFGVGTLGALRGDPLLAGVAFALSGACAGFLRYNLTRPARIFLGDGGSMPIGFLIAALGMAAGRGIDHGTAGVLTAAMTAGIVIFDTTMVSISRRRRGVTLLTGGRDHLTHRLLMTLRTPRRVAAALATVQAGLCGAAVLADELGSACAFALAGGLVLAGGAGIATLDSRRWRPAGIAYAPGHPQAALVAVEAPAVELPAVELPAAELPAAALAVPAGREARGASVLAATPLKPGVGRVTGRPLRLSAEPERAPVSG